MNPDIRKAILDELKRQGCSQYWLAKQLPDVDRSMVYKLLSGDRGASVKTLERMLRVLKLEVGRKRG